MAATWPKSDNAGHTLLHQYNAHAQPTLYTPDPPIHLCHSHLLQRLRATTPLRERASVGHEGADAGRQAQGHLV